MANLKLIDQTGKDADGVTLNDNVFDIEPNEDVVSDAAIRRRAGMRQGTHTTKNKSVVRGGGKKPWRQKGTGRARQGSVRAPQWHGGSTIFGPTPCSYAYSLLHKVRHSAIKSVLSQKLQDNNLIVLDQLSLDAPETKEFKVVLGNLNVNSRVLIISDNENVQLPTRSSENIKVVPVDGLGVIDAVNYNKLILTRDAVKRTEEALA